MSDRRFAIRLAIWHPRMGYRNEVAMARTYERTNGRTQQTNATETQAENLAFLTVRVGLWITLISATKAVA